MPAVTLPAPRTWASSQIIKAPYLRADVSDAVALLSQPPLFTGEQTTTTQSIPNSTDTPVLEDTEIYDNFAGHQDNLPGSEPANYYAQFAGWYLCEFTAPLNYTGGSGTCSAQIGIVSGGGSLNTYGGQRLPCSGTSGQYTQPAISKLAKMSSIAAAPGGDYICGSFNQSSGSARSLLNGSSQYPQLKCLWVAATSGTAGLIVPTNDAWPVPPSYITSAFMNKNVRDTIRFLIYPPIMEAQYNAGTATLASQTGVPSVGTTLPLATANVDNYGAFSTSTHIWTAPVAGVYYAYGQCALTMQTTGLAIGAGLTVTSANYNSGSQVTLWGGTQAPVGIANGTNCAIVRRRLRLNAGDTVALAGFNHDSGGTAATILGNSTDWTSRLIMVWRNS